jgi:hypothetical protein
MPADVWVVMGVCVAGDGVAGWVQPVTSRTSTSMIPSPIIPESRNVNFILPIVYPILFIPAFDFEKYCSYDRNGSSFTCILRSF